MTRPTTRIVLAALLALATVLFIVGAQSEKSSESTETPAQHAVETGNESAERTATTTHTTESEKVLGLQVESTGTQVAAVLVSLATIAVLLLTRRREWLYAVALIATLFTVLDIAEVVHQADRSKTGLAVLAALVALLHAGVAVGALIATREATQPQVPLPA